MKIKTTTPLFTKKIKIENALGNGITAYTLGHKNQLMLHDEKFLAKWELWQNLASAPDSSYEGRMGQRGFIDYLCQEWGYTLIETKSPPMVKPLLWTWD